MMELISLGQAFKINSGGTPSREKPEYYKNGDIPWVKTGDLKNVEIIKTSEFITKEGLENSSAKLFPINTILVAMYGATIGACSILKIKAATNQACAALLPNSNFNERFIYYFLTSIKNKLINLGVGGAQPNISAGILKDVKFPLYSLQTQKKIAEILDTADLLRQKDKVLIETYNQLTQSLFLEMFGDPVRNEKGWEVRTLSSIINSKRGISYGIVQRGDHFIDGVPVIRIRDIVDGNFQLDTLVRAKKEISDKYKRTILEGGELLISIRGTIGKIEIAPNHLRNSNISREVAIIPLINGVNKIYVKHLLRSGPIQDRLRKDVKGIAQSGINLNDLKKYNIIFPPDEIQNNFSVSIIEIERQKCLAEANLKNSEALFNALLQKAFNGELVKEDKVTSEV